MYVAYGWYCIMSNMSKGNISSVILVSELTVRLWVAELTHPTCVHGVQETTYPEKPVMPSLIFAPTSLQDK